MYTIIVESETRDKCGNEFTGVSVCVRKDGEKDGALVFVETENRDGLTEETDKIDVRRAMNDIIDDAKKTWWLNDDEVEELKTSLLRY